MKDDDAIKSFFEGMKEADVNLLVPPFEKPVKHKRNRLPYWYAAAMLSAIFVCAIFLIRTPYDGKEKETSPILNPYVDETGSLLFSDDMESWKSPTDGLLKEF